MGIGFSYVFPHKSIYEGRFGCFEPLGGPVRRNVPRARSFNFSQLHY